MSWDWLTMLTMTKEMNYNYSINYIDDDYNKE
jgi:hypothetical protein